MATLKMSRMKLKQVLSRLKMRICQSRRSRAVSLIGGNDGPTAIFCANKDSHKLTAQKREREKKLEAVARDTVPCAHTVKELEEYLVRQYGARKTAEDSGEYKEAYRVMKGNLVLRERPELVKTPMPDRLKGKPEKDVLELYFEQIGKRQEEAEAVEDGVIPMAFSRYVIDLMDESGAVCGDLTLEMEHVRQLMSVSYSFDNRRKAEPEKIMRDIYRYFGVSEEDIKNRTERFLVYAMVMEQNV